MINLVSIFIYKVLTFLFTLINMSSKRKNYYAVSTGRKIGIYTSYGNAFEQTHGYRGGVLKGYVTLQEAKQDMKVNGHNDPPVFNHKDVKINPSSSDSELDMNVSYQPVLPPDSPQSRLIAEIDHPEMDIDYLFTRSSRSDTQIKTVSISPNISPKKLIQDSIQEQIETLEPDEEVTFSNQNKKVSIKPECVSGENDVKPKHQHNNDLIKSDCTSCEAMMDLLLQMNNKLGQ